VQLRSLLVGGEWMKALESPLWWTRRGIFEHFEEQFTIFEKELKKLANCLSQFCQKFIQADQTLHFFKNTFLSLFLFFPSVF